MNRMSTSISDMIKSYICVLLLTVSYVHCNGASTCGQKEICSSFLDAAIEMITKAKENIPTCSNCPKIDRKPDDCADIFEMGQTTSGIYEIWPTNRIMAGKSLKVYCDMDTDGGGWTVLQRRGIFKTPKDYFYRDWDSYKEGFGPIDKDFWLGNDNMYALTNQKLYSARVDTQDVQKNKRFAFYDTFWIDDETYNYTLHISEHTGDAGDDSETGDTISDIFDDDDNDDNTSEMSGDGDDEDFFQVRKFLENRKRQSENVKIQPIRSSDQTYRSIDDRMKLHNNQAFSTFDRDNDKQSGENCAKNYNDGWWYNTCNASNLYYLHSRYFRRRHPLFSTSVMYKGFDETLEWTEIKIRPKYFKYIAS